MREWIGKCSSCGRDVYCENGFFAGEQKNGKLLCENCAASQEEN
ncbi:hypothetical protein [Lentibacillus sediminis]|nr:hypothetical protein [Lentibacillus sediminis]